MRILFLGSGPFGIPTLQRLHSLRDDLVVATVPDAPFGRSHTPRPSIIKEQATSLGLEVLEAERLRGRQGQQVLEDAAADLVITADIRLILGDRFLQGPKCGCYNLHGSLLPRWRGAAPVVRALLAGDEQLGVTLYKMVAQLDAGPVVAMESWTPPATVTTQQAEQHLSLLAAQLLERMLESLESGDPPQTSQQEEMVTLAPKVEKSEGWASWESSAIFVERQVRALDPWPRTRTQVTRQAASDGLAEELILHRVSIVDGMEEAAPGTILEVNANKIVIACGDGAIAVHGMQRSGKKPMDVADLLRGMPFAAGDRFHAKEAV